MPLLLIAALLSVGLVLQRTSLDLLDSLPIAVTVQNSANTAQTAHFSAPTEYRLDLSGDRGTPIWSSVPQPAPAATAFPVHQRTFAPGATTLAVYDWNELTAQRWSPLPGNYLLRVRLLTTGTQPEATVRVRFVAPLSPSALTALRTGQEYTLAGTLDATGATLTDTRGSAALTHRLAGAPAATPLAVRGFVSAGPAGSRTFTVERWAPLGPQPEPVSSP